MPVPATELRPRGALALFDSAIRLCSRSSGVWALTLTGGAIVTWALLQLVDAVKYGKPVLVPAALFTVAWLARGVCQGAACHHLEGLILGSTPPSVWTSFRAALGRLPSLVIAAAYLPLFNALSIGLTLGLGYFLLASHLAGWAVVMKGKGHPLALYGTCARMLGPARTNALGIRLLFTVIALVGLNLHLGANVLIYLGRKLVGLDLTYAQRFVSLDNGEWTTVVLALAFTLFEPLRAAVATLMLIDGRVRQEGLDLIAAVEQLPVRQQKILGRSSGAPGAATAALLAIALLCWPARVHAQDDEEDRAADATEDASDAAASKTRAPDPEFEPPLEATPVERLVAVTRACGDADLNAEAQLKGAEALGEAERAALSRLADFVEFVAWAWQDCDAARERLESALPLVRQTIAASQSASQPSAAEKAKAILARPEFVPTPEHPPEVKDDSVDHDDPNGWWAKFMRWLRQFIHDLFQKERAVSDGSRALAGTGAGAANLLAIILVAAVVVLVVVLLAAAFRSKGDESTTAEIMPEGSPAAGTVNSESALSRPPEGWAALADELAARGNFRDAVRNLYLALLSRLHRLGAIDYDPTLSNWDYLRQFRGRREWVPTFRELTSRFDFAWYGHFEVGREGYSAFRKLSESILASSSDESSAPSPLAPFPVRGEGKEHA